ncbi:DNA polymerase III subunit delta [Neomicrococcus lactis]
MTPAPASRGKAKASDAMNWRQAKPAPIILLSGSDDYIVSRVLDQLRKAIRESHEDPQLVSLDASKYQSGEILLSASPSLFNDFAIMEASNAATMTDAFLEDALAYLKAPSDDVMFVVQHSGGNRGKKLLDTLKKAKTPVIDCTAPKSDAEKFDFVAQEFRAHQRQIHPEAVRALVAALGNELGDLAAACRQLAEDVGRDITLEDVDKYYGGRVEATGFKVADAALAGRSTQALSTLRHALSTGTDPVPIIASVAMKLRQVAKVAGRRVSSGELASELGMAPWQVRQAQELANYWTQEDLIKCIALVAETDAMVKGESRDPEYAVERLVTQIALAARH